MCWLHPHARSSRLSFWVYGSPSRWIHRTGDDIERLFGCCRMLQPLDHKNAGLHFACGGVSTRVSHFGLVCQLKERGFRGKRERVLQQTELESAGVYQNDYPKAKDKSASGNGAQVPISSNVRHPWINYHSSSARGQNKHAPSPRGQNKHAHTHTHTQIYTWIFMIHTCSITNYACICKQSAKWKAKSKVRRKINGSFYWPLMGWVGWAATQESAPSLASSFAASTTNSWCPGCTYSNKLWRWEPLPDTSCSCDVRKRHKREWPRGKSCRDSLYILYFKPVIFITPNLGASTFKPRRRCSLMEFCPMRW